MATRTWILLSLALAAPIAACQSVDVTMAKPRYATRIEDLLPGAEGPDGARAPAAATPSESAAPVMRREAIITEELPPPADAPGVASTAERRNISGPVAPTRRAPEPRPPEPRPPEPRPQPGQDPRYQTPPADAVAPPAASGATFQYVVQPGDTVAGIGRRFGVRAQTLIELNGLQPHGAIQAGKPLTLPSAARDGGSDPYATGPAPTGMRGGPAPTQAAAGRFNPGPAPASPMPTAAPPPTAASVNASGRGRFIWPVRGDILTRFGTMGTSLRNDGINIGAAEGAPVKAAAAGEVVYAGSVIAAFGNMVLIKHADGWVTAYGYMSRIDVRMRDQVTQGQVIGAVGTSGGVSQPQLHFEIRFAPNPREKAAPVDPLPILR